MPDIGEKAPSFTLPRDGGGTVSLSDYAGKAVVLYFYPRDDTPGCTKESIGFTESAALFDAAGAVVVGVSKDSVKSHDKFVAKHNLGIVLASDENETLCEDMGVWVEKNMYGKKYMGIERATFLIDGAGVIQQIWRKVKVPGHVDAVLDAVKAL
ncbi:thioredoxin-dependent thiol peroxidase [Roseobacter sp. N2S]|uniref:thioredoxin-dependent thiol peroxidase n=1 Tax=Roseobacter sp. N2S TaxID=2663844 RepID=UPI00285ED1CD|nr:thioredoxin-dependent thiol peroxidase [Roseobacter sp. N2S]MDR6265534.1 peroxiredoxin Q/BCP [Roseobacter sp. N2S]